MSRLSCAVLGCVAVSTLTIGAQTQPVTPAPAAGAPGSTITVVGCVQNAVADGSVAGTPLGTSATPANAGAVANAQPPIDGYLLTGARPARRGARRNVRRVSGRTRQREGNVEGRAEDLRPGGNRDELAAHKGHRVEISGRWRRPCRAAPTLPRIASSRPAFSGCACSRSR